MIGKQDTFLPYGRQSLTDEDIAVGVEVLPVDYAGQPAELDGVMELARERNLVVIEDACHALGASYRGRPVGSVAHMTVFSFHPVKHLTTGEGGMVATNNREYADRLRRF